MSKQQNLWIKPRIEPAIMKQLTSRNNIKGMMQLLTQVLLIVIIGMLAYKSFYDYPLYVSIPLLYIYGYFYSFFAFGAAFHELSHRTVFSNKKVNDFFFVLVGITGWSNGGAFLEKVTQHTTGLPSLTN